MVAIIPPLFVDRLAKDFQLDQLSSQRLHAFVKAIHPHSSFLTHEHAAAAAKKNTDDLPALFNDLKIRLEHMFIFTSQQQNIIRAITQDTIFHTDRTAFKSMFKDVEEQLEKDKETLQLTNVYAGKKQCSLQEFTYGSAVKYKLGGVTGTLNICYMVHNAILRCFAIDHPELHGLSEKKDEESHFSDDQTISQVTVANPEGGPACKKQKAICGCAPKGDDFWSKVDQYFLKRTATLGSKLAASPWCRLVEDIV
ncbi:hypothetical protein BN946_scf184977.g159 [Trametes cinnabarina]|uniref:Uncharacterized protein n=1 Tax=Pycnoporus cinnabarinus TaxID=5643 RepID=A0A060SJ46_PYCCI|nr:hypothetical protein BN946_scf184977.g159 [Trametes cinnabarina]